ncbi:replication-associated recombination protein A [uncultured Thiothrix sp.]|uniref:replication-associated recombination protein A n=1 Tax=uncultured Thiothrix sp. TaxID=223185 RepID=UPI00262ED971|nr:replication-associated recombination protein A [uncultured Thiothrix sp.]HMT92294.1 replication-associated recombination protein A [Thiolinea sp.]
MTTAFTPLAERMRPQTLATYVGQAHLLAKGKPLRRALEEGYLHSMLFWGPPGTGKTTLARLIAHYWQAEFLTLSAVLSGVKEIRAAVEVAQDNREQLGKATVLFVDEVHRFNKAQQDAFLPHIESGVLIFIGATTENPSFELNNALLSRVRTYVLRSLSTDDIRAILQQALHDQKQGLGARDLSLSTTALEQLVLMADGDARRALGWLEMAADLAEETEQGLVISDATVQEVASGSLRRFDKGGDLFYEQISALHKAVRGTDPDAALYWFCRMLDGGCDPLYIARRIVRMASEDIGNADPRGLQLALNAWDAYERLGSPEGELMLAQAVVYLACAPKSNATYSAFKQAMQDAKQSGSLEVPMHLRNAPTKLMKSMDYGKGYRYAHDEANAYASGENYFPEALQGQRYYQPVERGLELKIRQKLASLRGKI